MSLPPMSVTVYGRPQGLPPEAKPHSTLELVVHHPNGGRATHRVNLWDTGDELAHQFTSGALDRPTREVTRGALADWVDENSEHFMMVPPEYKKYIGQLIRRGHRWPPEPPIEQQYARRVRPRRLSRESEEAAFHDAISSNTTDTTNPGVYADWLEEGGKPVHAALIRDSIKRYLRTYVGNANTYREMEGDNNNWETALTAQAHTDDHARWQREGYPKDRRPTHRVTLVLRHKTNPNFVLRFHSGYLPWEKARDTVRSLAKEALGGKKHNYDNGPLIFGATVQHLMNDGGGQWDWPGGGWIHSQDRPPPQTEIPPETEGPPPEHLSRRRFSRKIDHSELLKVGEFLAKNGAMPGYGQIFLKGNTVWYVGGDGDEWEEKNLPIKKFKEVPGVTDVVYEAEAFPKEAGWEGVNEDAKKYAEVKKFAAYRAPAGGMVVRGTAYKGGEMVPDMKGAFMNPGKKKAKKKPQFDPAKMAAARSKFKVKKMPPAVANEDGTSGPAPMNEVQRRSYMPRRKKYAADRGVIDSLISQLMEHSPQARYHRMGLDNPLQGVRGVLADALDENGRSEEAKLLREPDRHVVAIGGKEIIPASLLFHTDDGYQFVHILPPDDSPLGEWGTKHHTWTDGDMEFHGDADGPFDEHGSPLGGYTQEVPDPDHPMNAGRDNYRQRMSRRQISGIYP